MTLPARVIISLALLSPLAATPQVRLLPVDQAAAVPDFFGFRAQLQAAVARRDVAAVTAALSRDVKLSFGGDQGAEGFERMWRPQAPDTRLWDTLGTLLALGGTFADDGSFTAPYVFTRWPQGFDPFVHAAIIGTGVRVRAAPAAAGAPLATLDHQVVELGDGAAPESEWVEVRLPGGRTGFVARRFVRSPIDHRVRFAKVDGRWQIVSFLAGD